jgi:hypothetical protein
MNKIIENQNNQLNILDSEIRKLQNLLEDNNKELQEREEISI